MAPHLAASQIPTGSLRYAGVATPGSVRRLHCAGSPLRGFAVDDEVSMAPSAQGSGEADPEGVRERAPRVSSNCQAQRSHDIALGPSQLLTGLHRMIWRSRNDPGQTIARCGGGLRNGRRDTPGGRRRSRSRTAAPGDDLWADFCRLTALIGIQARADTLGPPYPERMVVAALTTLRRSRVSTALSFQILV